MPTYLLTWNPKRWTWQDFLAARHKTVSGAPYDIEWRCGNGNVQLGDRVFMMRQGTRGRGIFAAGYAMGTPVVRPHYDGRRERCTFIPVRLEEILAVETDPVITPERLDEPDLSAGNWGTRQSGIRLPDDVAATLEALWTAALDPLRRLGLYGRKSS